MFVFALASDEQARYLSSLAQSLAKELTMKEKTNEPWAVWAEHMQKWMGNPAAMNPFAIPGASMPSAVAGFANPFAATGNPLDPQAIMRSIDPTEIDRRIADMRAVEAWLKFSLTTLEMSIKTLEMQRDAYASFAKMGETAKASAEAVTKTVKRAARTTSRKR
jgi:hypothetical protein